jgi:hypothetical protein
VNFPLLINAIKSSFSGVSKAFKELLMPLAWALITWGIVLSNPRGWALSAGIFIILYLLLNAWEASLAVKAGKNGQQNGTR